MKNIFGGERDDIAKGEMPLQHDGTAAKERITRETWHHYYNDNLRERGIITEEEWLKMRRLIG